jgi:hypothetical protein
MKKRWNKTVIDWHCGLGRETKIPVTDWHNPEEKHMHKVHGLRATAMPDRMGKIEIEIKRESISPTTKRAEIIDLISVKMEGTPIEKAQGKEHSSVFTIDFRLGDGDQFCETALKIVREIFRAIGIEQEEYCLTNFSISQESYIQLDDNWITFANWLRIQFKLPIIDRSTT